MSHARRKRRIAVVTGTRAEYGVLCSTLDAIEQHPNLKLQLIVTGIHLLRRFGYTAGQIEADGRRIDAQVPMQSGDDTPLDQARGLSRGVLGIARFLHEARSDVVVVLGDRIEATAGALAGTTTGTLVAHIHGGDIAPGDMDDALRHSITKLAHIHMPATRDAADRIVRLGERRSQVYVVGAPGLDDLYKVKRELGTVRKRDGALVVQHAYGRDADTEKRSMNAVLRAVKAHHLDATIVYPNTDRGHTGVLEAIDRAHASNGGRFRVFESLPRREYLETLLRSRVLVGNSSSGIIEAAAVGMPAVNVGDRQKGRLPASTSVINARESFSDVRRALARALGTRPEKPRRTPYGDGNAGQRIAQVLARARLDTQTRRKQITF
jgi:UDP-N-acetylglucosamine 2-epimerase (non-hydrolysing)/GDP/UDP-N,N'-diacetylbacillosamine 2-epimerase (hydrolysing)